MRLIQTASFELAVNECGDKTAEKLALVLPGRLDTKDYPHMMGHSEYLAGHGFLAVSFDPPGTWDSPGEIDLYTTSNYLKAVLELIDIYGMGLTLVLGHSLGASIALMAGSKSSLVDSVVAIMGPYKFDSALYPTKQVEAWKNRGYLWSERDNPLGDLPKRFKLPYGFCEDQKQYNLLDQIENILCPKLFIYGERDTKIVPEVVKKAYKVSKQPKVLKGIDCDHDYRRDGKLIEKVNVVLGKFLKEQEL